MNDPRETLQLTFIDSNILFRMFAASPQKIRQYGSVNLSARG